MNRLLLLTTLICLLSGMLSACGQSGGLYLPDKEVPTVSNKGTS